MPKKIAALPNLFSSPVFSDFAKLENRQVILEQIKSGELESINFDATVFTTAPNKNHVLFKDEELQAFADSFTDKPFLYDHRTESIEARHGTIISSSLDGDKFIQTVKLTTQQGMTDFLEEKFDRFSIGWHYDDIICMICNSSWFSCYHWPGRIYETVDGEEVCELLFTNPQGKETSAVNVPATYGTEILAALTAHKEEITGNSAVINAPQAQSFSLDKGVIMSKKNKGAETDNTPDPRLKELEENQAAIAQLTGEGQKQKELADQLEASNQLLIASCNNLLNQGLASSGLPEVTQTRLRQQFEGTRFEPLALTAAIDKAKDEVAVLTQGQSIAGPARGISGMLSSEDLIRAAMDDLLGAERDPEMQGKKVHALSGIREAYLMLTGDYNFSGGYFPELAQLATNANFPSITRDTLNKILVREWADFGTAGYNWWEKIATIEHFNNLKEIDWLMTGTIGSLPTVAERGEYTSLPIGDKRETSSFIKYGGYIPLTLEAMMNDETRAFAKFPKELAKAALRNISEQVAALFTDNSGAGPTLQDTGALFNATAVTTAGGHANLLTTALGTDYTAWSAIAKAMYNQSMHVAGTIEGDSYLGTGKKQAVKPKFCLVPIDLEGAAQALFSPSWNPLVESVPSAGGPTYAGQVEPVVVPEWTDANNYAAVADPKILPSVMIGEVFGITPQIILAGDERNAAMFTNDESRLKVRQFLAVGVADYRGLHKSNVA